MSRLIKTKNVFDDDDADEEHMEAESEQEAQTQARTARKTGRPAGRKDSYQRKFTAKRLESLQKAQAARKRNIELRKRGIDPKNAPAPEPEPPKAKAPVKTQPTEPKPEPEPEQVEYRVVKKPKKKVIVVEESESEEERVVLKKRPKQRAREPEERAPELLHQHPGYHNPAPSALDELIKYYQRMGGQ